MRNKYLKQTDGRETVPFETTEKAWFWYCLCRQLGFEKGHRQSGQMARPCETSDIFISLKRLLCQGVLRRAHLLVLHIYGDRQEPPHINFGASERVCRLWQDAIAALDVLLREKGIVAGLFLIGGYVR